MYDLKVKNAYIVDGTGRPGFFGDIGIIDDTIIYTLSEENYMLVPNASKVNEIYDWLLDHSDNFDVEFLLASTWFTENDLTAFSERKRLGLKDGLQLS